MVAKRKDEASQVTRCNWNDHGNSCGARGILSTGNLGFGPWYCREHFYKLRGYSDMEAEGLQGNKVPKTPLTSLAVREMVERIAKKQKIRTQE